LISFLVHDAKLKLPQGNHRKRFFRTATGYALLAISIITSLTTLAISLKRPQITALQTKVPIAAGELISPSQVHQIEISSNSHISTQFANEVDLSHMVTRQPLASGQLVERSDMTNPGQVSNSADEMVVPLTSSKAPLDQMLPGDYLQLISTVGTGSLATSRVVASAAKVIGIVKTNATFGQSGQSGANVLLSISNPIEVIAIAQAETAGSLIGVKVNDPGATAFQGTFSVDAAAGPAGTGALPTSQPNSSQNPPTG